MCTQRWKSDEWRKRSVHNTQLKDRGGIPTKRSISDLFEGGSSFGRVKNKIRSTSCWVTVPQTMQVSGRN